MSADMARSHAHARRGPRAAGRRAAAPRVAARGRRRRRARSRPGRSARAGRRRRVRRAGARQVRRGRSRSRCSSCAPRVSSPWARWTARWPTPKRCAHSASAAAAPTSCARALIGLARVQGFSGRHRRGGHDRRTGAQGRPEEPQEAARGAGPLEPRGRADAPAAKRRRGAQREAPPRCVFDALGDEMRARPRAVGRRLRAGRPRAQGGKRARRRPGARARAPDRRPLGRGLGAQHPLAPEHRSGEAAARAAPGAGRVPRVGPCVGTGGDLQQPGARLPRAGAVPALEPHGAPVDRDPASPAAIQLRRERPR